MKRYEAEGESGLEDRSSRPHNSPRATPPEKVAEIVALRQEGKLTGDHIAPKMNMHQSVRVQYIWNHYGDSVGEGCYSGGRLNLQ